MFRRAMEPNDGMLFVFEQPGKQCFWMKNTLIPLSVAFIADDGSVVNIEDMQPQTLDDHCSAKPVRYVLEMNKGWFARGASSRAASSAALRSRTELRRQPEPSEGPRPRARSFTSFRRSSWRRSPSWRAC